MSLTKVTNEVFRSTQAMSFSRLSKLADGPQSYKASLEEKEFSLGLAFGSVVDILLTNPERFEEEFYVMTADKPSSDMMLKFCEVYAETGDEERAHAASGFKIGLNAVKTKFETEGKPYYNAIILGKGKKIIDASILFAANQTVAALKSNPFTKRYFVSDGENIQIEYQTIIIWEEELIQLGDTSTPLTIKFKGALDVTRIDHERKEIEIMDIKTGSEGFWKSYWKHKLYLQGAMYYFGLKKVLQDTDLKDYKILPIGFIYADSNLYYPPAIYAMNENDLEIARAGYYQKIIKGGKIITSDQLRIKGYQRLAQEIDWHNRNDMWDYPYEVYQSNGVINIDSFNPKL